MIVPAQQTLTGISDLAVPLPRYFQLIQQRECAGWGVSNPDDPEPGCRDIWTKFQRDEVERYLAEAQEEIERQVGFSLVKRWIANEQHPYSYPVLTEWGKVIEGGVKATSDISLGEVVDHTNDPAIIGPIATTVVDEDEIYVYHPGTDVEIIPSAITIAGGNVTIEIPRCRMVLASLADNPAEGLSYSDLVNFEAMVDVKRFYNDPSTQATLIWPHQCTAICAQGGCSDYTHAGCEYVRLPGIGSLDVTPATYNGGTWTVTASSPACCRGKAQFVRLNYRAGVTATRQMEDAVIRLAHSKMPDEFCGCEVWQRLWRRDRTIPQVLTRERLNCPFGVSQGAWVSWTFTRQFRLVRGYAM